MSLSTVASADFDSWDDDAQFELIVSGFDLPDTEPDRPVRHPHRVLSDREAINLGRGYRRHRSHEREA